MFHPSLKCKAFNHDLLVKWKLEPLLLILFTTILGTQFILTLNNTWELETRRKRTNFLFLYFHFYLTCKLWPFLSTCLVHHDDHPNHTGPGFTGEFCEIIDCIAEQCNGICMNNTCYCRPGYKGRKDRLVSTILQGPRNFIFSWENFSRQISSSTQFSWILSASLHIIIITSFF